MQTLFRPTILPLVLLHHTNAQLFTVSRTVLCHSYSFIHSFWRLI